MPVSIFAPNSFPSLPKIDGLSISSGTVWCDRQNKKNNLVIFKFENTTSVAGVFTTSIFPGHNINHCREILKLGTAKALVVISGNANVANGIQGDSDVNDITELVAKELNCSSKEVFLSCTGMIGIKLPIDEIKKTIPSLISKLSNSTNEWDKAAENILTIDTFRKMVTKTIMLDGKLVTLNGIAKGSGMIHPKMATTLSYIITDLNISSIIAQKIISKSIETSFNCVCLDGDTSTSDSMMLFATNKAGNLSVEDESSDDFVRVSSVISDIMEEMAEFVARDAECAKKFVTIKVVGAESFDSARKIGFSLARSVLFKVTLSNIVSNFGKIVMAIGSSGEKINIDKINVKYNNKLGIINGAVILEEIKSWTNEEINSDYMNFVIDVGVCDKVATIWTSDVNSTFIDANTQYIS